MRGTAAVTDVTCRQCRMEMPADARRCGHCGVRANELRTELIIGAVLATVILGFVAYSFVAR